MNLRGKIIGSIAILVLTVFQGCSSEGMKVTTIGEGPPTSVLKSVGVPGSPIEQMMSKCLAGDYNETGTCSYTVQPSGDVLFEIFEDGANNKITVDDIIDADQMLVAEAALMAVVEARGAQHAEFLIDASGSALFNSDTVDEIEGLKNVKIEYDVSLYGGGALYGGLYGDGLYGMGKNVTIAIIEAYGPGHTGSMSLDGAETAHLKIETLNEMKEKIKVTDVAFDNSLYGGHTLYGGLYGDGLYGLSRHATEAIIEAYGPAHTATFSMDPSEKVRMDADALDSLGQKRKEVDIDFENSLYGGHSLYGGLYGDGLYGLSKNATKAIMEARGPAHVANLSIDPAEKVSLSVDALDSMGQKQKDIDIEFENSLYGGHTLYGGLYGDGLYGLSRSVTQAIMEAYGPANAATVQFDARTEATLVDVRSLDSGGADIKTTSITYDGSLYGGSPLYGGLYGESLYGLHGGDTRAIIDAPGFTMHSTISLDASLDSQIHVEGFDDAGVLTQTADISQSNALYGTGLYGTHLYGALYGGVGLYGVMNGAVLGTLEAYGASKIASMNLAVEDVNLSASIDSASTRMTISENYVEDDLMASMVKVPLDRIALDSDVNSTAVFSDVDVVAYEASLLDGSKPRADFDEQLLIASISRGELEQILNSFLDNLSAIESYRIVADALGEVDYIIVTIDGVQYPVTGDTVEEILAAIQALIDSLNALEVRCGVRGAEHRACGVNTEVTLHDKACAVLWQNDPADVVANCPAIAIDRTQDSADADFAYYSLSAASGQYFLVATDPDLLDPMGLPVQSSHPTVNIPEDTFANVIMHIKPDGKKQGMKSGKKQGSILWVYEPTDVVWVDNVEFYPFFFESDSDWTVDVCLEVPEGYAIIEGDECLQSFVANESKSILFKVQEVGSIPFGFKSKSKFRTPSGKMIVEHEFIGVRLHPKLAKAKAEELKDKGFAIDPKNGKVKKLD